MISKEYVKRYCNEDVSLIENYDKAILDNTQIWICHHRYEIQNGTSISIKELKEKNLYWNRPAKELIFLTRSEHARLHGVNMSDKTRIKLGLKSKESWKDNKTRRIQASIVGHSMKGKIIKTPEQCKLNSEARKKYYKTHKIKWFNNGKVAVRSEQCPKGFIPGMLYKWYNNGIITIRAKSCPEGFIPGRIKKN